MSCITAGDCVAVGSYSTTAGSFVLAERWNGVSWQIEPTPAPAPASGSQVGELFGVSCTGARDCFAVGGQGQQPLVEHWNGADWQVQTAAGTSATLESVSCKSTTDCTAVGDVVTYTTNELGEEVPVVNPLAEHWDGVSWEIQPTPGAPGATGSVLSSVACTSASDCTAVGNATFNSGPGEATFAEQWNGTEWQVEPTPSVAGEQTLLDSVSCPSASNCMAVGTAGNSGGPLVERWNGTDWQLGSSPATGSGLIAVSCGPRRCTVLGEYPSFAARWNGSSWRTEPFPVPTGATAASTLPIGLSCVTPRHCTAVGAYETTAGQFTLAAGR